MKIPFKLSAPGSLVAPLLLASALLAAPASGQISLGPAVDLALRNSPRVKGAQDDVAKAQSALKQTTDVFIPSISVGAALGQAYGYSPYPPTLFNVNSGSLIYSPSQSSYIKSARAGLVSAQKALDDVRETVAEDTALTFVALDHDQQREAVLHEETSFSDKLLQIVQERFDSGIDSRMSLLDAKLSAANLRVARIRAEEDSATDRNHLARLMGVPAGTLRADGGFPASAPTAPETAATGPYANASIASAFANADAKLLQARGDTRFLYRPQLQFASQYSRYATFTDAFANLKNQYGKISSQELVFGVQITIPMFDRLRRSKGVQSLTEASKALHDAEFAQMSVLDAQDKLTHTIELTQAQAEVASLEQQRAQEQLAIVQVQLQNEQSSPQPMTPKDEQNARIAEREKYMGVIDSAFQLHQAEISLLRQTGQLEQWLRRAGLSSPASAPSTLQPQP